MYFTNFLGAIFGAALIYGGGNNGHAGDLTPSGHRLCAIAIKKTELEWYKIFFRGILANILVCLAVICAAASTTASGKILAIFFPISVFVAIGFEHSIANMYTFSMATMLNCDVGSHGWYWLNLLLSSVGNLVGATLIAISYWLVNIHGTPLELSHVPTSGAFPLESKAEPQTPFPPVVSQRHASIPTNEVLVPQR